MHIFFAVNAPESNYLDETESLHAVKVLRLKEGDEILIINGNGGYFRAKITQAHPKKCVFEIFDQTITEKSELPYIHIAVAPTKNSERIEWMVEKCIEIGVQELSFIQCQRSEKKQMNMERINKLAISALKQSKNLFIPQINPLQSFKNFISGTTEIQKFIAYVSAEEAENKHIFEVANPCQTYVLLIGPEGDFTAEEISLAMKNNFKPVSLGNTRLRTETAGIVACHSLNLVQYKK